MGSFHFCLVPLGLKYWHGEPISLALSLLAVWSGKHWELSLGDCGESGSKPESVQDLQPLLVLGRGRGSTKRPVVFSWGVHAQMYRLCKWCAVSGAHSKRLNSKMYVSWESSWGRSGSWFPHPRQLSSFHFTMESISVSHPESYLGELPWRVRIILQVTEQNGCFNITWWYSY